MNIIPTRRWLTMGVATALLAAACTSQPVRPTPAPTGAIYSPSTFTGQLSIAHGRLSAPEAFVPDGAVDFVLDTGANDVLKIDATTHAVLETIGPRLSGYGTLHGPQAIAADTDHLYVLDTGNNRLLELSTQTSDVLVSVGKLGTGNDQFQYPAGLALCGNRLYVSDQLRNRVLLRNAATLAYVNQTGTLGSAVGQLNAPWGIACTDSSLFVADSNNHRIVQYSPDLKTIVTTFAIPKSLGRPTRIATDGVYVYGVFEPGHVYGVLRLSDGMIVEHQPAWHGSSPSQLVGSGLVGITLSGHTAYFADPDRHAIYARTVGR